MLVSETSERWLVLIHLLRMAMTNMTKSLRVVLSLLALRIWTLTLSISTNLMNFFITYLTFCWRMVLYPHLVSVDMCVHDRVWVYCPNVLKPTLHPLAMLTVVLDSHDVDGHQKISAKEQKSATKNYSIVWENWNSTYVPLCWTLKMYFETSTLCKFSTH